MTSHLRHELHALVDGAPTVDVVDRALGTARGLRRRRVGAGALGVAAVAAALVAPFAFLGPGRAPLQAGSVPTPAACGPASPTAGPAALAEVGPLILGHLPAGFTDDGWHGISCSSPEVVPVNTYLVSADGGGQVRVSLIPRADREPGMIFGGAPAFTATRCADVFAQSYVVVPSPSGSPTFTPSADPSGSGVQPSGSPTFSPSGSPSGYPSGSPSGSPSGLPVVTASSFPMTVPTELFCHEPTATAPIVFGLDAGSEVVVAAVWADHRAIVVRSSPLPPGSSAEPVTVDQLTAMATDPALLAHVAS